MKLNRSCGLTTRSEIGAKSRTGSYGTLLKSGFTTRPAEVATTRV